MERKELAFKKNEQGDLLKVKASTTLRGVLFVRGKKANTVQSWLAHLVNMEKQGKDVLYKAKDVLPVPVQLLHNKKVKGGITTEAKSEKYKIPLDITVVLNTPGEQVFVMQRVPGEYEDRRIHHLVNGQEHIDAEIWEKLDPVQQAELKQIDVWAVADKLIKWLENDNRKPSFYVGALQAIYEDTKDLLRVERVPKMHKVPTGSVRGADVMLTITAPGGFLFTKHFKEGGYRNCKGEVVYSFAYVIQRIELLTRFLEEQGFEFAFEYEQHERRR